jgi:uncharacterized protein YjbI with pentapeptide repeats
MNLLDTLTRAADEEQLLIHPLPKHAAAGQEEHLRQHYALLLAAVLTAQPAVSDAQTRLFRLLLDSLALGDIRGSLYAQARALEPAALVEAARLIRGADLACHLALDALVLLRLEAPLNDEMSQLVAELAALLGVSQAALAEQAETAALILGLNPDAPNKEDPAVRSPLEVLAERWPGRQAIPLPLTAEALRAGLHDGAWRLEADLTVDFAWQASNATLIFLHDATLRTVAESGEVTLTDCDLRNARLHFANECDARFERCQITGDYGNRPDHPAIESLNGKLDIVDCDFTTRDGVAIEAGFGELAVTKSRFTGCGRSDGKAGAIIHVSEAENKEISDCHFERCIGKYAGAVYCNKLSGIHNCEFIACESRAFDDQRFAHIAVFSSRNKNVPVITGCRFEQSSLYVRNSDYTAIGSNYAVARDCQFRDGNFIYYNFSSNSTSNCTFKGGESLYIELKA